MNKARALELLGGSVAAAADAVGISSAAVSQWPDELPARIEDRVLAALARKHLPAELIGQPSGGESALLESLSVEGKAA